MTIVYRMPRPRRHFLSKRKRNDTDESPPVDLSAGSPRLLTFGGRVDVDNLSKFVLDCYNLSLYEDDRQIVSLQTIKIFDNRGDCEGSTSISIRSTNDRDVLDLLTSLGL
jgi:Holliday junction resolvase RusA-like endonuclease